MVGNQDRADAVARKHVASKVPGGGRLNTAELASINAEQGDMEGRAIEQDAQSKVAGNHQRERETRV